MTEKVAKYTSESDDESEKPKFQSPEKLKDNSQATLTTTVSAESDEYDTASEESGSGEYSDESETEEGGEEEDQDENEDGSIILDVERQSGDGQENDGENKKKVDDDEDRSNPQYIPKKGTFYEHDDRTAEDLDAEVEAVEGEGEDGEEPATKGTKDPKEPKDVKPTRKWQASQDRWTHDRFEEQEQAPKSRNELVSAYGYDIRSEDAPPKARRRKRYGKGPNKYTRNWEDEAAYAKQPQQRKPRPEDFPALGTENNKQVQQRPPKSAARQRDRQSSEYKENNDRNIERNEEPRRSHGGPRPIGEDVRENNQRRNFNKDNKGAGTSNVNNNNRRSQNNQRNNARNNDNYNRAGPGVGQNTIEFINQNRNKGSGDQKDQISAHNRYAPSQSAQQNSNYHSMHSQQQQQQQPQQQQQAPQQGHYQMNNSADHKESQSSHNYNTNNARISNQRYQTENLDYHQQMSNKDVQRDARQTTPIAQNQPQVIQPTQQQLQNYVQMQQQQQQQQQQQKVQVQQMQQQMNQNQDPSRSKRYSSLRQRGGGMENPAVMPEQSNMMSEAAILQQLQQNEKLKHQQMQSTLAHQKQISYHQAITPQAPPPQQQQQQQQPAPQNANPQYPPPQAYYAQTPAEYPPAVPQATPQVQTQQPPPQMITTGPPPQSASAQYAQYAPQSTPSYIQNAYLPQPQPGPVPQAQPPPQMYVQSAPPQTQFQPQYSGYTPNFTPQAATNQSTPIYQSQPPPITYFAPTAAPANVPPTRVTRRPTNAIPILAPPERAGNGAKRNEYDTGDKDGQKQQMSSSGVGSAENIDHILDNMFVRRPPLQPTPIMKSASPSIDVAVADSVKNLSIKDDTKEEKLATAEKVG